MMNMWQLINEPWAGDIYSKNSLLLPGVAGRNNLQPFYDHLNAAIRSVDNTTLIFYEPVTWSVFLASPEAGTGFNSVPGGPQSVNYYFCWLLMALCPFRKKFRQVFHPGKTWCPPNTWLF